MFSLIGHFHPVFVHLPIGILVIACILQLIERRKRVASFAQAIGICLLVGGITAVLSCITGYILSRNDDYDALLVEQHQWMGIAVSIITITLYFLRRKQKALRWHWPLMILLIALITITGHLGGSLTHGSDYLSLPSADAGSKEGAKRPAIPQVQEAAVYKDIVQPLLQEKCYSCHNRNKQKGGFRMDEPSLLMKGGKNGVALIPGKAEESDLIKRLLLPREDEDHMPPKEKPQLTEQEVALLHWWIASGASFDKQVKELEQPEAIKPVLFALQGNGAADKKAPAAIPPDPVERADDSALKRIKALGAVIIPVSRNSNYLSVNFLSAGEVANKDLEKLVAVKQQLVWVKLGLPSFGDSALTYLSRCSHITRLHLDNTGVTDAGLPSLLSLKELQYLNLVGTKVTAKGLMSLKDLPQLQSIYCYKTAISPEDLAALQKAFPKAMIDTGGYQVPMLPSDTTEVKPAPRK